MTPASRILRPRPHTNMTEEINATYHQKWGHSKAMPVDSDEPMILNETKNTHKMLASTPMNPIKWGPVDQWPSVHDSIQGTKNIRGTHE